MQQSRHSMAGTAERCGRTLWPVLQTLDSYLLMTSRPHVIPMSSARLQSSCRQQAPSQICLTRYIARVGRSHSRGTEGLSYLVLDCKTPADKKHHCRSDTNNIQHSVTGCLAHMHWASPVMGPLSCRPQTPRPAVSNKALTNSQCCHTYDRNTVATFVKVGYTRSSLDALCPLTSPTASKHTCMTNLCCWVDMFSRKIAFLHPCGPMSFAFSYRASTASIEIDCGRHC